MSQPASRFVADDRRTSAQRWRAIWVTIVACLLAAGALFLTIFGDRFVFRFADAYTVIALGSTGLSMPFILYRMARSRRVGEEFSKRYPTSWVRNWVVMPLTAAILAGLVFAAPLGWLFATAAWYGGPVHYVKATATDVGSYARRKHCNQSATLRLPSVARKTCLDRLYPPATMRDGQVLNVGIVTFSFGFLIVSIASADPVLHDVPASRHPVTTH
ncbi:MAG TPA: hypothetical protein VF663_07505 [Telluria sp.]|jgi:hypothetical protein